MMILSKTKPCSRYARLALPALALSVSLAGAASAQTFEATFAHAHQFYAVAGAEAFKAHVEAATGGDVQINLIRHGALGVDDRAITDQLRLGELEFNVPGAGGVAGVFPQAQVYSWPFLFTNRNVFWMLPNDPDHFEYVRDEMLESSGGTIRLLGLSENSVRHLYTTRGPIQVPEDLATHAIKMRTQPVPMHQRVFEALGSASIVAVSAPERYTALQTGLIDGLEGGLASAWDAGLMEVADYVSLTGHMYEYLWWMVNDDFYQSLPVEYQEAIDEAALIGVTVTNAASFQDSEEALAKMAEAGKTIYVPTAAELAEWQAVAEPVGREFIEQEVSQEFIDQTLEAIERTRERVERLGSAGK
jgi:TRAP-type C4-dicarboxylate transport system substrate-binding protein